MPTGITTALGVYSKSEAERQQKAREQKYKYMNLLASIDEENRKQVDRSVQESIKNQRELSEKLLGDIARGYKDAAGNEDAIKFLDYAASNVYENYNDSFENYTIAQKIIGESKAQKGVKSTNKGDIKKLGGMLGRIPASNTEEITAYNNLMGKATADPNLNIYAEPEYAVIAKYSDRPRAPKTPKAPPKPNVSILKDLNKIRANINNDSNISKENKEYSLNLVNTLIKEYSADPTIDIYKANYNDEDTTYDRITQKPISKNTPDMEELSPWITTKKGEDKKSVLPVDIYDQTTGEKLYSANYTKTKLNEEWKKTAEEYKKLREVQADKTDLKKFEFKEKGKIIYLRRDKWIEKTYRESREADDFEGWINKKLKSLEKQNTEYKEKYGQY